MATLERYNTYDGLAWIYNRYWGREYPQLALPILEKLLLARLPEHARILDLCCGTGHVTRMLMDRGFLATGIDGSGEMLTYARENVPGCEFIVADARSFHLSEHVHGAISTFESLNHILKIGELEAVFQNVYACLCDGGIFVFDLLMEEAYTNEWGKSSAQVEEDNAVIVRGGYDPETRMGHTDITLFRRSGTWERSDVTVREKCYTFDQAWAALEAAGFAEISSFDAQRNLGMPGSLGVGRMFFRAKKGWPE